MFQHRAGRRRHLRPRGGPRPDPEVRVPRGPDPQGGHHLHPPQPQQPDAGQRHRPAQAPRGGGPQGGGLSGVSACKGNKSGGLLWDQ